MSDFFMTSVHYVNDSKLRVSRVLYNIRIFWKYSTKKETIVNCYRAVLNEIWILFQLLVRMSNYLFQFSELMNFSSSMMIDFWQFRCISRSNYTIERRNRFVVQLFRARLKLDRTRGTRVLRKKLGPRIASQANVCIIPYYLAHRPPSIPLPPGSCALFSISMRRIERLRKVAAIVRSPVVVVFIVSALVGRVPVVRWTYSFFSTRDAIFSMLNVAFSVHRVELRHRGSRPRWKRSFDRLLMRVEVHRCSRGPIRTCSRDRCSIPTRVHNFKPWVSLKTNRSTLLFVKICFLISVYKYL